MWAEARLQDLLLTDATGVNVQAPRKCERAHFFVVIAPDLHVLFGFTRKHNGKAINMLLGPFRGYLVADAHTIYDHLYRLDEILEVACWAHTRRYFFKSISTDPIRAKYAMDGIGALFSIERDLKKESPIRRKQVRAEQSGPKVDQFFNWCREQQDQVLDGSPIAKAFGYALNQERPLRRFLEDGRLPIHNNASENALRRQAVGRKNWLFVGSDNGGETNARFASLLASCRLHDIEPWSYLRDLFCLLPSWPKKHVLDLAPAYWTQTSSRPDVQLALAANPFRRITEPLVTPAAALSMPPVHAVR
jgi:hypothetical protein